MKPTETTARLADINARQEAIEREYDERHQGRFTPDLKSEYERLNAEYVRLKSRNGEPTLLPRRSDPNSGSPMGESGTRSTGGGELNPPRAKWVNCKTGEPVRSLLPTERLSSHYDGSADLSIGRMLQAVATNNWRNAEAEKRVMALSGSDSGGGHFLVPDELSAQVIDLARAASVVFPWGAQTVEMKSDTLRIARQVTDATYEAKAENAAFTGSDLTFGDIMLSSHTVGTIVTASRELAEDAPNFATVVEGALQRGLGAEVDRLILRGNGGSEGIAGIKIREGIGSTGSVAGIAWEDLHTAVTAIRVLNHEPNGYVVNPEIAGDLDLITSGDGTNSAKLWLGPPPSLAGVTRFPTTGLTNADIVVGDGSKIVVGFRTQARVETTTQADEAFEKHQVKWKITIRFDFGLTHVAAFHLLTGITS